MIRFDASLTYTEIPRELPAGTMAALAITWLCKSFSAETTGCASPIPPRDVASRLTPTLRRLCGGYWVESGFQFFKMTMSP